MKIHRKYIISILSMMLVIIAITMLRCTGNSSRVSAFKSNFENIEMHTWIGTQYWSDKKEDWKVLNNRVECLVSDQDRKIYLLSHQFNKNVKIFEMSVCTGFFNQTMTNNKNNWAGFRIGSKKELSKQDNDTSFKDGINIGVCTNGSLFIGASNLNNRNNIIVDKLHTGVNLITYKDGGYTIDFSVFDINNGMVLARISKNGIAPEMVEGHLALVSIFEDSEQLTTSQKSVWFKDWSLKDAKLKRRKGYL